MKPSIVFLAVLVMFLVGCKNDNESVTPPVTPVVSVTVSNLPVLSPGDGHYQVWATFTIFQKQNALNSPLHDSGFVSLGEFVVGADGHSLLDPASGLPASFSIPAGQDPQLLNDVIITIQNPELILTRALHEDPGPAIIGAAFHGTASEAIADLTVSYQDAFGTDFSAVTGTYTITAPTSVPADSNSGVWFYDPLPAPAPSLQNLASLGEHWKYEGWVVDRNPSDTSYYSSGKFSRADSADGDGAGPGSGPGAGLNFPGQDFITGTPTAPNLTETRYAIRITIEPNPDNSTEPFFLTLLSTDVAGPINNSEEGPFAMQNVISSHLPTAHITVSR